MKILWFSLSPCGSMRRNNTTKFTQTWMVTLEDELKKNTEIKLSVAYFSNTDEEPFLYDMSCIIQCLLLLIHTMISCVIFGVEQTVRITSS